MGEQGGLILKKLLIDKSDKLSIICIYPHKQVMNISSQGGKEVRYAP